MVADRLRFFIASSDSRCEEFMQKCARAASESKTAVPNEVEADLEKLSKEYLTGLQGVYHDLLHFVREKIPPFDRSMRRMVAAEKQVKVSNSEVLTFGDLPGIVTRVIEKLISLTNLTDEATLEAVVDATRGGGLGFQANEVQQLLNAPSFEHLQGTRAAERY